MLTELWHVHIHSQTAPLLERAGEIISYRAKNASPAKRGFTSRPNHWSNT